MSTKPIFWVLLVIGLFFAFCAGLLWNGNNLVAQMFSLVSAACLLYAITFGIK